MKTLYHTSTLVLHSLQRGRPGRGLRGGVRAMAAAPQGLSSSQQQLWARVCEVYDKATDPTGSGAAQTTDARTEVLEDARLGVKCVVRVAAQLQEKAKAKAAKGGSPSGPRPNPFLPYDEQLWVAHLGPGHTLLLNKFNVVAHHTLVVTRAFEDQGAPLTEADLAATWHVMQAYPEGALGFFNGGGVAGASQPHKHLQVVPLPLAPEVPQLPFERVEEGALAGTSAGQGPSPAVAVAALPYQCFCASLPPGATGATLLEAYRAASEAAGRPAAFNLLLSAKRLVLVPRRREGFGVVPVNSLGYAGSLFVRSREELEVVREQGLLRILAHVGVPW